MEAVPVPIPPPHPSTQEIVSSIRRHRLFGFPIAHSASPAFQNLILRVWYHQQQYRFPSSATALEGVPTYSLCETRSIDEQHFYRYVRHDDRFGGAGVTMPLKVAVASQLGANQILDELDDIGRATMTVNTIVVLPSIDGEVSLEKRRMIGTNTDYLGIRHALLRDIAKQNGLAAAFYTSHEQPFAFPWTAEGLPHSAFIIGSGGTCRSAVYALHMLGLSPLYILNRDAKETQDVMDHFRSMKIDLRPLRNEAEFEHERQLRQSGKVGPITAAVGAIPAIRPSSADEKMVYTLAHAFFQEPYDALARAQTNGVLPTAKQEARTLSLPAKRPFLEMCYIPRLTPMLEFASTRTTTWSAIGGVEAMIEQGLAQARMWAASSVILEGKVPKDNPLTYATRDGDDGPLGRECEEQARRLAENMSDIVLPTIAANSAIAAVAPVDVVGTTLRDAGQLTPSDILR
jgi:quinate dehydrogenase